MHQSHPPADRGSPVTEIRRRRLVFSAAAHWQTPGQGNGLLPREFTGRESPGRPHHRSPRTSAAGRIAAPSPSPRRSQPHLSQCGSCRAAWHAPSSPFLFWFYRRRKQGQIRHLSTCSRLDGLAVVRPPSLRDKCSPSLVETHDSPITYWKRKYIWS